MSEPNPGLLARLGGLFRRGNRAAAAADEPEDVSPVGPTDLVPAPGRPSLLRPFAKRDAALTRLQDGFDTLTDLMGGIKENLGDQGKRQDELLGYLSHLPKAIEGIPETNRLQVESLKAIAARLDQQNEQQHLIAQVLGKMADNDAQTTRAVAEVGARLEVVAEQGRNITDNLTTVSSAMQSVSRTSSASAAALVQMKDNIDRRDGQIERILHRQASRFTALLTVAIGLSLLALGTVAVVGWQVVNRQGTPAVPPATMPAVAPANGPARVPAAMPVVASATVPVTVPVVKPATAPAAAPATGPTTR